MGKAPTFPFYASDFIVDTLTWSEEERGAIVYLMAYWWVNGPCSREQAEKISPSAKKVLEKYSEKIIEIDGKISSKRLEFEREKKNTFLEKQRINGAKGGRPKNNPSLSVGLTQKKPLEKENEKEKENRIEKAKDDFLKELEFFKDKYDKELLIGFFEYWTEHGKKDTRVRYQKEKSFSMDRRLKTWKANSDTNFGRKTKTNPQSRDMASIADKV